MLNAFLTDPGTIKPKFNIFLFIYTLFIYTFFNVENLQNLITSTKVELNSKHLAIQIKIVYVD